MFHVKQRRPKRARKAVNDGHGLHKAAVDYLARQYPQTVAAVSRHGVTWNTIAHGAYTPFVGQAMKTKRVTIPGEPDLWISHFGELLMIELKSGKSDTKKAQRERHAVLRAGGIRVEVCRAVDDVQATVASFLKLNAGGNLGEV